jgi:hypothetical protein
VLFQSVTTRKFGPFIERDRATVLLVEFFETLFQPLMDMVRLLRLDFEDDREPRFAVHECRQATGAGRAEDCVAFKIAQPEVDAHGNPGDAAGGDRGGRGQGVKQE